MVKKETTLLFQLYLNERHHRLAFKTAVLCALPKPGQRPKYLPQSYWLIVLLSCLGKTLEKIIVCRLSKIAIKTRLISLIHFGAVARCLAVDVAAMLTNNVKKAWQDDEVFTALVFNTKGAFNTVTKNRLTTHLWE